MEAGLSHLDGLKKQELALPVNNEFPGIQPAGKLQRMKGLRYALCAMNLRHRRANTQKYGAAGIVAGERNSGAEHRNLAARLATALGADQRAAGGPCGQVCAEFHDVTDHRRIGAACESNRRPHFYNVSIGGIGGCDCVASSGRRAAVGEWIEVKRPFAEVVQPVTVRVCRA